MKTDLIERAALADQLRRDGQTYKKACKQAGINTYMYSVVRRCLSLNRENSSPEAIAALEAIKAGKVHQSLTIIHQLNGGRRPTKSIKALQKAVELITNTCEHCTELVIPQLEPHDIKIIVNRLKNARQVLGKFMTKIKETSDDQTDGD